jgi:hypothetical protein
VRPIGVRSALSGRHLDTPMRRTGAPAAAPGAASGCR